MVAAVERDTVGFGLLWFGFLESRGVTRGVYGAVGFFVGVVVASGRFERESGATGVLVWCVPE